MALIDHGRDHDIPQRLVLPNVQAQVPLCFAHAERAKAQWQR